MQSAAAAMTASNDVNNQLIEAAVLMGVGMTSVFLFLCLLIVAMHLLAALVTRFPGPQPKPIRPKTEPVSASAVPDTVLAAVTAAVHQYRKSS